VSPTAAADPPAPADPPRTAAPAGAPTQPGPATRQDPDLFTARHPDAPGSAKGSAGRAPAPHGQKPNRPAGPRGRELIPGVDCTLSTDPFANSKGLPTCPPETGGN
jgi:hypothetical protein